MALRTVRLRNGMPVDIAFLEQGEEDILGDLGMVGRAGGGEQVIGNPQPLP